MNNKINNLTMEELFKETYSILSEKYNPQEVVVSQELNFARISNLGFFGHHVENLDIAYDTFGLFESNQNLLAIAIGKISDNSYSGSGEYRNVTKDIFVLKYGLEQTEESIQENIKKNLFWKNNLFTKSLIVGEINGKIYVPGILPGKTMFPKKGLDNIFQEKIKMNEILESEMQEFIIQESKSPPNDFSYSPPNLKDSIKYGPKCANFLSKSIESVLFN